MDTVCVVVIPYQICAKSLWIIFHRVFSNGTIPQNVVVSDFKPVESSHRASRLPGIQIGGSRNFRSTRYWLLQLICNIKTHWQILGHISILDLRPTCLLSGRGSTAWRCTACCGTAWAATWSASTTGDTPTPGGQFNRHFEDGPCPLFSHTRAYHL